MRGTAMSYSVVEEFIVIRDGVAVHHSEVGSVVELTGDEAYELVGAGKVTEIRPPDPAVDSGELAARLDAETAYLDDVAVWLEAEELAANKKPRRGS